MGDPAGIGPEIIAKAFLQHRDLLHDCGVFGDANIMREAVLLVDDSQTSTTLPFPLVQVGALHGSLPEHQHIEWGKVQAQAGKIAANAVVHAAQAVLSKKIKAMVTAPLHKEALLLAGVNYPGHTELLQSQAAKFLQQAIEQLPVKMMLVNPDLRVVLVSIHVSLRRAIESVTQASVFETIQSTHDFLTQTTKPIARKKIAVSGLNPHAGENGLFGDEEIHAITPAVLQARQLGIDVHGPFAPDTIFMRAKKGEFDAVVAMYHDQGLIPVKYLGVEEGVNVTLGLPLIRTSPDHGTAFDIAGKNKADPASLLAAIALAKRLAFV